MKSTIGWIIVAGLGLVLLILVPGIFMFRSGFYPGMMGGYGMMGRGFGFFGPFGILMGMLVPFGGIVLLLIGIIGLVANLANSGRSTTPSPPAIPARSCPNCGKPAQPDWSNCPYCGTLLS